MNSVLSHGYENHNKKYDSGNIYPLGTVSSSLPLPQPPQNKVILCGW
jgi:hypothetical protein